MKYTCWFMCSINRWVRTIVRNIMGNSRDPFLKSTRVTLSLQPYSTWLCAPWLRLSAPLVYTFSQKQQVSQACHLLAPTDPAVRFATTVDIKRKEALQWTNHWPMLAACTRHPCRRACHEEASTDDYRAVICVKKGCRMEEATCMPRPWSVKVKSSDAIKMVQPGFGQWQYRNYHLSCWSLPWTQCKTHSLTLALTLYIFLFGIRRAGL